MAVFLYLKFPCLPQLLGEKGKIPLNSESFPLIFYNSPFNKRSFSIIFLQILNSPKSGSAKNKHLITPYKISFPVKNNHLQQKLLTNYKILQLKLFTLENQSYIIHPSKRSNTAKLFNKQNHTLKPKWFVTCTRVAEVNTHCPHSLIGKSSRLITERR